MALGGACGSALRACGAARIAISSDASLIRYPGPSMSDSGHMEEAEERLRNLIHGLPRESKQAYYKEIRRRTRDPDTYAALNWALIAGLHHFYLGKWLRGIIDLATLVCALLLIFSIDWGVPVGIVMIVTVSLLELWELFNAQMIVRRHNLRQGRSLLRELGIDSTQTPTIGKPG
jgi:TM2 domain-containing membrane protein YozV